ncbi:hypothetical protein GGF46_004997 [Coemansia sp. RSA 552]|nr:hypothetical protein GGF46_004997 [Coemansia sp. RSA 552]
MEDQNANPAGAEASKAAAGAASETTGSAPAPLTAMQMDAMLSLAMSAPPVTAPAAASAAEPAPGLGLDFSVDSLNLDSLGSLAGFDFDVSGLLSQVSGSSASVSLSTESPNAQQGTPIVPASAAGAPLLPAASAKAVTPTELHASTSTAPTARVPEPGDTQTAVQAEDNDVESVEPVTAEDEHHPTEAVTVVCPVQIPLPKGLGSLYGQENMFRSLCHGILPTNAEWSSLNILAVTWPQLEAAPVTNRRLAQRDIPDASAMPTTDSMRALEERRAPSSTIHLYRLHVHPPPVWGADAKPMPIEPSLLPLCDLRIRQQWDEQASQAGMDRLVDGFAVTQQHQQQGPSDPSQQPGSAISVSPLSGWHGGTSQAGMGERMRVASAPRCAWSSDCRMLAASDCAGRFEIFQTGPELNSWHSVYHIDFDQPVVACLWLASTRKYGISRQSSASSQEGATPSSAHQVPGEPPKQTSWDVDPAITVRRLPFFGPRNTQGEYALVVITADGQLALVYQRDEQWVRIVSSLRPSRPESQSADASGERPKPDADSPWSNIPEGHISHADMMLVSKKWIYLTVHRAGALAVDHPHEPGAIPDALKRDGQITAPTVEVYRIQVEFASDYSPRLFATPLVVQPIILPVNMAHDVDGASDSLKTPRITHLKLITALNPEVRPVEKNVLGEEHYFPLVFVSLGAMSTPETSATYIQVLRLEAASHAQRSVSDLLHRPPPLRLSHMWTEHRRGLLLSVIANRAERQQLRYLFAKPSDKDYRALVLTWADGRVEMLRNYQEHDTTGSDGYDRCVSSVRSTAEWVIGSVLSPHYTAYFQLVMRPRTVELGKQQSASDSDALTSAMDTDSTPNSDGPRASQSRLKPDTAVDCSWNQGHARFRLGWTPFFGDSPSEQPSRRPTKSPADSHVKAYCGDLLAVRILNKEDPTDLVAMLANLATYEESQPIPGQKHGGAARSGDTGPGDMLSIPMSRTLSQALFRSCTLLAGALRIGSLELDPLSSASPYVRRLLGAIMQIHFLAQHNIQAASLGILLHISSVVEARMAIFHEHILQTVTDNQSIFDVAKSFSGKWQRTFPSAAALVLWCVDLLVALTRDTYLYLNVRCADAEGSMRPLCDLEGTGNEGADCEAELLSAFRGEAAGKSSLGDSCLLPGRIPNRVALLFHRSTLDAVRNLVTFVTHLEFDLLQRIQFLNSLPPNASSVPEYASMVRSRGMVVSTAQQLAHALEYLPVSIQRLKDFLADVRDLYAADEECMSINSQAMLLSTSAITEPFRKYLPQVARSFERFILDPDVTMPTNGRSVLPSALVLHDTRWIGAAICRANVPGLGDGTAIFETPWRVETPIKVTDPRLIDADEDTLVPAAELAEWEREKGEFERALDEDNVLFDIDDPGFIFFDTSDPSGAGISPVPENTAQGVTLEQGSSVARIFAAATSRNAAAAPVRITTKVPDFSDVAGPDAAGNISISDADADFMFSMPLLFDTMHGPTMQQANGPGGIAESPAGFGPPRQSRTRSNSASAYSPCMTPRATGGYALVSPDPSGSVLGRRPPGNVQHFVPHYSSTQNTRSGGEPGSGWQFISTPRDPKLHIPTLLAQHAFSLAVLNRRQQPPDATASGDDQDMAYCIDWSRSEGIVIEGTATPGLSAAAPDSNDQQSSRSSGYCRLLVRKSGKGTDRVDVVQKTMLPTDAPVKMCLRCGHVTRLGPTPDAAAGPRDPAALADDIGWIRRFDILCICGGSWIAI